MDWGIILHCDTAGLLSQVSYSFLSLLLPLMALPDFLKLLCPLQPSTNLTVDLSQLVDRTSLLSRQGI